MFLHEMKYVMKSNATLPPILCRLLKSYVIVSEKRGNFAQNVTSCYEPVKMGNVLAAVVSSIFGTEWDIDLFQIPLHSL